MHRITITLDDELMAEVDAFMAAGGYGSRSEAMRDLTRSGLSRQEARTSEAECVAALVYVYDHGTRQLSARLTGQYHDHHDVTVSTMHVHLDRQECMEVAILRGPGRQVQAFGEHVIAERGVRHGRLLVIPETR